MRLIHFVYFVSLDLRAKFAMRFKSWFTIWTVLIFLVLIATCDGQFFDYLDVDDYFQPMKIFAKPMKMFKKTKKFSKKMMKKVKYPKYVLKPYILKKASLKDKIKDKVSFLLNRINKTIILTSFIVYREVQVS